MQQRCPLCGHFGLMGPNTYSVGSTANPEKVRFCLDSAACKRRAVDRVRQLQREVDTHRKILSRLVLSGQIKELTK